MTMKITTLDRFQQRIDNKLLKYGLLGSQNWSNIEPSFIVSTGRTGTKFFTKFFDLFPNIYSVHEPYPDFLQFSLDYARGLVSYDTAVQVIEKNRRVICRSIKRLNSQLYIESNNRLFSLIKPLKTVFPNAKIVYIIRDGRDYASSGMSRLWYTENDLTPRLRADMFPSDPYASQWEKLSRFEKIVWRWQKKDGFIYQDFQSLDNAIHVKFEDIFNNPERTGLFEITRFLGIPDTEVRYYLDRSQIGERKVNANSKISIPKWDRWDDRMKQDFEKIAGDHMKLHYNYESMV
jgi:Sulfotransferase family